MKLWIKNSKKYAFKFYYIKIDMQYYLFLSVLDYYFFARLLEIKKKILRE